MSSSREFEPTRLDVEKFAGEGAVLQGNWPLPDLPRLCESAAPDRPPGRDDRVVWEARGERKGGVEPETWLHIAANASMALQCQRCLAPVEVDIVVDRRFRFVAGEAAAAALDAASEDDVLASTRALDLRGLIEDELLLALPLVPMHAACSAPQAVRGTGLPVEEIVHPFAGLAALKRQAGGEH